MIKPMFYCPIHCLGSYESLILDGVHNEFSQIYLAGWQLAIPN